MTCQGRGSRAGPAVRREAREAALQFLPSISYFCDPRMPGKATILFPSLYFVTRFSAFGLAVSYGERIGWVKGFGMG